MSNSKLYVGNLSFDLDEAAIRAAFEESGEVTDVFVVMDKMTGRPRGFAFVTMGSPEAAQAAIEQWNGTELGGRALTVNEARPKEERSGGFGGGGGRSFGGDRRGGGGGRSFGGGGGGRSFGGDRRGGGGGRSFGGDRRGGGGGGSRY